LADVHLKQLHEFIVANIPGRYQQQLPGLPFQQKRLHKIRILRNGTSWLAIDNSISA